MRWLTIAAAVALTAAGCGSQQIEAGAPDTGAPGTDAAETGAPGTDADAVESPPSEVLESHDAILNALPQEWVQERQWVVEGAEASWDTGCEGFDGLSEIHVYDAPAVTVWTAAGLAEVTQRVGSVNVNTTGLVGAVRQIPADCPTLTAGGVTVEVSPFDETRLLPEVPTSEWAAVELSAYPVVDETTEPDTPTFDPDRRSLLVVLGRHNVLSVLFIDITNDLGAELAGSVVSAADRALQSAPAQSVSVPEPTPDPAVAAQRLEGVELMLDREDCRNGGGLVIDGVRFQLVGDAPLEWRTIDPLIGDVEVDGEFGAFIGPEGAELAITSGPVPAVCTVWEEPSQAEPEPQPESVDRLDCTGRGLNEVRVPDEGQPVEELVLGADPAVVTVEAGGPLQWWGLDADATVVAAVFLGDAEPADYQIFTCADG